MPLVQCSDCGRRFSSRLADCPACGTAADATGEFVPPAAPARHPTGAILRGWQPGMRFAKKYLLVEKLELSSLGEVWKARDLTAPDDAAAVALHLLPPEIAEDARESARIGDQLGSAGVLAHDSIAAFLGLVRDGNESALVQELAVGADLPRYRREWVKSHGSFAVAEALRLCGEIADGLDSAHFLGIVHGDLEPENILVDARGGVKVFGFGMTAAIRSSLARLRVKAGDDPGVRPYLAPEAWDKGAPCPQTDQYALAAIFYELVSGYPPFVSDDPAILRQCVLDRAPGPLPQLTHARNEALLRALAKNPGDRFLTCREFIDALAGVRPVAIVQDVAVEDAEDTVSVPLPPPPPGPFRPQSPEETAEMAEPPPLPPPPGPYATPRRSSTRHTDLLSAREVHERRRTRRHSAAIHSEEAVEEAAEAGTTASGRHGWEDVEAVEEKKRVSVRWGGVALVTLIVLGVAIAALYDHRERTRIRQAEEADRVARLEAVAPAPAPPRPVEPPPPPARRDAAAVRTEPGGQSNEPPSSAQRWLDAQGLGFGQRDGEGATLLHRLATVGGADAEAILALFPGDGVDVDAVDSVQETPLHKAMYFNNAAVARWLLGHGARMDAENWEGNTPIDVAVTAGSVAALTALLENGADAGQLDERGETLLHHAIRDNRPAVVSALLGRGADIEARDRLGRTSLLLASALSRNRIVDILLENGADTGARNDNGRNAAHLAAMSGGINTLRAVVEAGADPALTDADGKTPLDLARDQLERYRRMGNGSSRDAVLVDPAQRIRSFTAIIEWLREYTAE